MKSLNCFPSLTYYVASTTGLGVSRLIYDSRVVLLKEISRGNFNEMMANLRMYV